MRVREDLVCPQCKAPLPVDDEHSMCPNGHGGYQWIEERAVFDINVSMRSNDNVLNQGFLQNLSSHRFLYKAVSALISLDLVYKTHESKSRIFRLAARFEKKKALNVGSGSTNYGPQFINTDIGPFPHVQVVTSLYCLPYPDEFFDFVVSQAVLEHVSEPRLAVEEMIRVLKPGGELYAEIPFIQGFHPTPEDYQRYTISGIEYLFRPLSKIEKGVVNGPASALCWIAREFLAILLSFDSQTLYKVWMVAFTWVFYPLKFVDVFLEKSKFSHFIASGFYFHGKKQLL